MDVEFRILGPLEVWAGGSLVKLRGPRQERCLAALLLEPRRLVTLDLLIDAVWDGRPPSTARRRGAGSGERPAADAGRPHRAYPTDHDGPDGLRPSCGTRRAGRAAVRAARGRRAGWRRGRSPRFGGRVAVGLDPVPGDHARGDRQPGVAAGDRAVGGAVGVSLCGRTGSRSRWSWATTAWRWASCAVWWISIRCGSDRCSC